MIARRLGRRDGDDSCQLNDWAVGTSVLLMAFSVILSDLRNINNLSNIADHLTYVIGILCVIFLSIDHDRYRSWERDTKGLPINKKKIWLGIVFPNLACVSVFGIYQAYKVGVL